MLVVSAFPAFGQFYPMPASTTEAPAICNNCNGTNSHGEPNAGLPMFPYSLPIRDHVGRIVDSANAIDETSGMRTARAGKIRVSPARGTTPGRIYIQLGATIAAYTTSTFFTTTLPGGMQPVTALIAAVKRGGPVEKALIPQAYVYPELKNSNWLLQNSDGNDRLYDFDVDDRGYIYAAYTIFGWGIIKDDGSINATAQLPLTSQWIYRSCTVTKGVTPCDDKSDNPFGPNMIVTIKSGSNYYTITNNGSASRLPVYNVTNPNVKQEPSYVSGIEHIFAAWAKSPDMTKLGIIDGQLNVRIYDAAQYVTSGPELHATTAAQAGGRKFAAISSDEDGNFWAAQSSSGNGPATLWKFTRSGNGYVASSYDVPSSSAFTVQTLDASDGFIGMGGYSNGNGDVRLFKIEGGVPVQLDIKNFLRNYYHDGPAGYAVPDSRINPKVARAIKYNNKTYLIYSAFGLGDVYELQAGDTVSALQVAPAAEFYGDEYSFSSSTSSEFPLNVNWNFGNPESGADNDFTTRSGTAVHHRFSGLTTASAITAPKNVKVKIVTSPDVTDTLVINMKAPQARFKAVAKTASSQPPTTPVTNNAELVYGDDFADTSDGQADGHFNVWTIDGQDLTLAPGTNAPGGGLGPHTVKLVAKYGAPTATALYQSAAGPFSYKILPFVTKMKDPVKNGAAVTFGATARYTKDVTIIPSTITQWETIWSLKSGATDVVPPQTQSAAIGSIPNFVVTATIPPNSVLTLTVNLPTAGLPAPVVPLASYVLPSTLETPTDVTIVKTGCANVGAPCTLTATPASGTANWDKVEWSLKVGGVEKYPTPATGTSIDVTSKLTAQGDYTAIATVSRAIFSKPSAGTTFHVDPTLCDGPLPTVNNMSLGVYGTESGCNGTGCKSGGEDIILSAQAFNYNIQQCDKFTWTFGDGGSATTTVPEVTHHYSGSTGVTAKMTITNTSSGQTSTTFTKTIAFGTVVEPPPPPTCTAPASISVSYQGASSGCQVGSTATCKVGEVITFSARRNNGNLQSCDSVFWTFGDGTTSTTKTPTKIFAAGTFNVVAQVSNNLGSSDSPARPVVVVVDTGIPGCNATPSDRNLFVTYTGVSSGCTPTSTAVCRRGETIRFDVEGFNYQVQSCDTFLWNFNDGTATSTARPAEHVFNGTLPTYTVTLRVQNPNGTANLTRVVALEGGDVPATPVLTMTGKPGTAGKNSTVTFTASSDIANTTGWTWEFSDGSAIDNSQNAVVASTNSIAHTFTKAGSFTVKASARNAAAGPTGAKGQVTHTIVINDVPEHRFLIPVVTHGAGLAGSVWRTDLQIYNPDPSVSAAKPMTMKVTFKGVQQTLTVPQATVIFEDFMNKFTSGDDSGPVVVSVTSNYQPQIWSRTYNQNSQGGTFGQFIPAVLLSGDGAGSGGTEVPKYYLAGLRQNSRYRANIGFVNPTDQSITVKGTVYEAEKSIPIGTFNITLASLAWEQKAIHVLLGKDVPADRPFSIEFEGPAGKWFIAYCSYIDGTSNDPTYIQGVRGSELSSEDYREVVLPGIGHFNEWRSDVTIFNADSRGASLDVQYYDQSGALKKSASVALGGYEFLQLDDVLRSSQLQVEGNSLGTVRVKANASTPERFPMIFARTYFDSPAGSYGQGIGAVSGKRANVKANKPAFIPAVRSSANFYTNIGLTNVTDKPVSVRVTILDADTGAVGLNESYELAPYQSLVRSPVADVDIIKALSPNADRASFRVEITGGTGEVWAYASVIDRRTKDPEYIPAIPTP